VVYDEGSIVVTALLALPFLVSGGVSCIVGAHLGVNGGFLA
jgi:hypothetical protein